MIYLQKSRKKSKKVFFIFVVVVLFLIVAGILTTRAPGPLSSAMHTIGLPFWKVGVFLSNNVNIVPGFLRTKTALVAENDALKSELLISREKIMNFEVLGAEHARLLEEFGRIGNQGKTIATVLVRPPQTPYDMLILDAGSTDGVSSGDAVYTMGGIILGTVSEVAANSSNVTLFTRTDLQTEAFFERTNLAVTLRGIGGGTFEVEVPLEADVLKDDVLIVPKLEPSIVGVVSLVESSVKNAFKRVLIQTPANISYTRFVLIEQQN